jgi:hypothetical protein
MSKERDAVTLDRLQRLRASIPVKPPQQVWTEKIGALRKANIAAYPDGDGFVIDGSAVPWVLNLMVEFAFNTIGCVASWQSQDEVTAHSADLAFKEQAKKYPEDGILSKGASFGFAVWEALTKAQRAIVEAGILPEEINGGIRVTRHGDHMRAEVLLEVEP